ncbi:unnamed protein product [Xylocopa violacea]|uniref:Uncharacterized protein n=1 Tax=Xylocopa violacea TaxID=135666 RepID=A0ABP1NWR5_XYLVO
MFRGYRGSLGLLRGLFNPLTKRNLTPIRYIEDRNKKTVDGVFSWLKDMLKPDAKATEAGSAIDRKATTFDYPRTKRAMLGNFELKDRTGRNFTVSERSFDTPEPHEPPPMILLGDRANLCGVLPTCDPKLAGNGYRYSSLLIEDSIVSILNPKRNYHSPYPRHDFLTVASPVRTIMGCTPRNTKPPIREPNMPEKMDKKEDKKEKKQKKPVIRMEGESSKSSEKVAAAESGLHDNMDVNLEYQWGIRLPEESAKSQQLEPKCNWNESLKQMGSPNTFVGDTKRSGQQISPSYDMDALRTMKNLRLTMSSTNETEAKAEGKTEVPGQEVAKGDPTEAVSLDASKENKEAENVESFSKIRDTAPNVTMESNVVDEDYNVPADANFDAEITAWKDLVLKSKVPIDPDKQEFLDTEVGVKRAELLSIRPEPPEPKLDVQAVPTANDELMKDEIEEDVPKDFKGNLRAMDVNRTVNPGDVQKLDSKKLHTGSIFLAKRYSNSVNESRRRPKLREPLWSMESMDNDKNFMASDYSTRTEDGWKDTEPTASKAAVREEPVQNDLQAAPAGDQDVEKNISDHAEQLSPKEAHLAAEHEQKSANFENQDPEVELADNLNAIDEREIEMSLSEPQQEKQHGRDRLPSAQRSSKKYEAQDFWRGQSDTFHDNYEYGTTYEDDFYAGYESMSMEPPPERPNVERNRSPAVDEHTQPIEEREVFNYETEPGEPRIEYITEGKYIKVPGDPYPYSREHFNKWRLKHEDIHIGPTEQIAKEIASDSPVGEPSTGNLVEIHQPVRKMSYDSRVWGTRGWAARR